MTHADEARRIAPPESYGTLCNEIAAALAAAERRGIERAAEVVPTSWLDAMLTGPSCVSGSPSEGGPYVERVLQRVALTIRALLPAEPAAKCATCGVQHPADHSCTPAVDKPPCAHEMALMPYIHCRKCGAT